MRILTRWRLLPLADAKKPFPRPLYFLRSLQKLYLVGVQTAKNKTSNPKLIARPIFHQPAALKPNTY
ncbi:hypothetical protein [Lactiplantibacillus pentosus]|uniref:Uncharacterized protein n=1 Tax=Lactiplantibacillus pentosus TaxID=1589 RepID=A0ABD7IPU8_LACPE|nr:hypothetical protein [Lactiplantibacillus pentosus]ASG80273.1 hypothetical protein CEW82_10595 [Lactiplantibacillus pentosus]PRO95928.1 hypothetical protein C6Y08_02130 [Lactiplantibacillus pentosus]RMW47163.1 hypothetical protein D6U18_08770 [Lactiplantibacillus pentosus]